MTTNIDQIYKAAYACLKAGKYADSLRMFDDAISMDPANSKGLHSEIWNFQARALLASGRLVEAVEIATKAVSADPRVPEFRATLADSLMANGENQSAKSHYEEALASILPGEPLVAHIEEALGRIG